MKELNIVDVTAGQSVLVSYARFKLHGTVIGRTMLGQLVILDDATNSPTIVGDCQYITLLEANHGNTR